MTSNSKISAAAATSRSAGLRAGAGRFGFLVEPILLLLGRRRLVRRLVARDLSERYRNTWLGFFWIVVTPLLYLSAFSFVFGYVLPGREAAWSHLGDAPLGFVVGIFAGLAVFWLFSEISAQSSSLMQRNRNLITDVVFPTETLCWSLVLTSTVNLSINMGVLAVMYLLVFGQLGWQFLAIPIVVLPLVMLMLGVSWILAALGVLARDVAQFMQPLNMAVLFMSGVFFPSQAIPADFRAWFLLNPVARTIEDLRMLVFDAQLPSLPVYTAYLLAGLLAMGIGLRFFRRLKPKFAERI